MLTKRLNQISYPVTDFICSFGVWLLLVIYRREVVEHREIELEPQQFINATVICLYWLILYAIAGLYGDPYRKSRIREISQILKFSLIGVLIIFFAIFLNDGDTIPNYQVKNYLKNLGIYFSIQFLVIATAHLILNSITIIRIRSRKIGFPTLLIGGNRHAYDIYSDLENRKRSLGYIFKGYISTSPNPSSFLHGKLKRLGTVKNLEQVIRTRRVEEAIIALDEEEKEQIGRIIEICERTDIRIQVVPGTYDYLVGSVRSSNIMGTPLIEVSPQILSPWEAFFKRSFDIVFSLTAMLFLLPIYITIAILVKLNSEGPVFYRQERIGKGGIPFFIYKFRSMYINAEKAGPSLSSQHDPRITKVGKVLRKLRLDELPQFWNVLIGDMSIVGPRPEREFYIQKIVQKAPHYRHLHKVRPGVTSWGQVKYGYAENVDEMVERLKYDILYIENISLLLDIKIILYTIIVMIEGRGK